MLTSCRTKCYHYRQHLASGALPQLKHPSVAALVMDNMKCPGPKPGSTTTTKIKFVFKDFVPLKWMRETHANISIEHRMIEAGLFFDHAHGKRR